MVATLESELKYLREKSEQQEQEIATKKLLLAEVDDSLQAYKLKAERLEE